MKKNDTSQKNYKREGRAPNTDVEIEHRPKNL